MKYEELLPITREDALEAIRRGPPEAVPAVLRVALYELDHAFAEETCMVAAGSRDPDLARAGICGLGHVARVHGMLSDAAVRKLEQVADGAQPLRGVAMDAMGDYRHFCARKED